MHDIIRNYAFKQYVRATKDAGSSALSLPSLDT